MGSSIHICDTWNSCWYQEKEGEQQIYKCAPGSQGRERLPAVETAGWWGRGEARSVLGCRHMNPPVHSLGGSKGCMGLLGVPVLYKILKVGYWIWEQGPGHHDDLRDKIKERKNKLSKATQLKWKATALPLESRGTVLLSPVRIRVPWGPGIYPLWDWHRWSLAPHRMADCFGFFPLHAGGSSLPPSSRDWKTGTEQRS